MLPEIREIPDFCGKAVYFAYISRQFQGDTEGEKKGKKIWREKGIELERDMLKNWQDNSVDR